MATVYHAGVDTKTGYLTEQAQRFCAEYVSNGANAHQAARVAGYTSCSVANRLMKSPPVLARIGELRAAEGERLLLREGAVRDKLVQIAFADLPDVVDYDGKSRPKPKAFKDLDSFGRSSLSEIEDNANVTRVKQHNKVQALLGLGKMLGEVHARLNSASNSGSKDINVELDAGKLTSEERATLRALLLKAQHDGE